MSRIAAIQMCSSNSLEDNLNTAEHLIQKASNQGALLTVLPEMFVMFGKQEHDKLLIKEKQGSGVIQDRLSSMAQKYNIWIVGGTIPVESDSSIENESGSKDGEPQKYTKNNVLNPPNKIKAASLVFDNTGKQVARYDKIHLFDVVLSETEVYKESDSTEPGRNIVIIDTPVGKLGLCVCFDLRFPHIFQEFHRQGVELIAAPSAFTVKTGSAHWELLCRSRAIDTFSYVIGACQGGLHPNGRSTYGHSMIVNPWGVILAECKPLGNGVIVADIHLDYLYDVRRQIPRN